MPNRKNDIIIPFIAKPDNLKVGLNNLGNRNAAERLFTTLLPGMNNVTQRIRYYSFYCWLLMRFYEGITKAKGLDLRNYIRYSEYLLALIHAYNKDNRGIPGITTAEVAVEGQRQNISIKSGAEGIGIRQYWAYPNGILGQYYIVSMMDLRLVAYNNQTNAFYNITKGEHHYITGEQLGEVFDKSVCEYGNMFLECVHKGTASPQELEYLYRRFNMHVMTPFKEERELLKDMLLQEDYPNERDEFSDHTWHRKSTVKFFLSYVRDTGDASEQGFARYMYNLYRQRKKMDETSVRWYAYYLNDQWQYNCSIIFSYLLEQLRKSGSWTPMRKLASDLASEFVKLLGWNHDDNLFMVLESNRKHETIKKPEPYEGFYNLINLASVNIDIFENVRSRCEIKEVSTFGTFCRYVIKHKEDNIYDFMCHFIEEQIIYQHYVVSFKKQQATGIASQKFILENDSVLYVAPYGASHTAPRIAMLANFLTDLGLMNDNGITNEGKELINKLEND